MPAGRNNYCQRALSRSTAAWPIPISAFSREAISHRLSSVPSAVENIRTHKAVLRCSSHLDKIFWSIQIESPKPMNYSIEAQADRPSDVQDEPGEESHAFGETLLQLAQCLEQGNALIEPQGQEGTIRRRYPRRNGSHYADLLQPAVLCAIASFEEDGDQEVRTTLGDVSHRSSPTTFSDYDGGQGIKRSRRISSLEEDLTARTMQNELDTYATLSQHLVDCGGTTACTTKRRVSIWQGPESGSNERLDAFECVNS